MIIAFSSGSEKYSLVSRYSWCVLSTRNAGTPGLSQLIECWASAASSTGGAPPAETKKRSSWSATRSRKGKKTSLRLPSASEYQTLLREPGAAPNAILRPGPHIGGAPGPPGASIGG